MNKETVEKFFRSIGVVPEKRERIGDYELYIGDGVSSPPHDRHRKSGVGPDDYPGGMYVTWWWLGKDEKLDVGQPLFNELLHNPELGPADKKRARINSAREAAMDHLARRKKHATN